MSLPVIAVTVGDPSGIGPEIAVKAARAAFDKGTWANMAPAQRKRIMLKLAELMMKNREELALLETLDMGKPIRDASSIDIPLAAETIAYYGEAIDKVYDEVAPTDHSNVVMILREPLGAIGTLLMPVAVFLIVGRAKNRGSGRPPPPQGAELLV